MGPSVFNQIHSVPFVVERNLCIHRRSNDNLISNDSFESGSFLPNCRTCSFTFPRLSWFSVLKCRPTLCGVVLCDIPEVFTLCSLSVRLVCPMYCLKHT